MRKVFILLFASLILFFLTGCGKEEPAAESALTQKEAFPADYEGSPVPSYDVIYTLDKIMSLTFDQLLPEEELLPLLNELAKEQIPATFFISSDQLETYPEAVEEIIAHGHKIEIKLDEADLDALEQDEVFYLLQDIRDRLEEYTDEAINYIRLHKKHEKVSLSAAMLDLSGVIHAFRINTADEDSLMKNMRKAIGRGKILAMDPKDAYAITPLTNAAAEVGFCWMN